MKRIIQLIILMFFQLTVMCGNSLALNVEDFLILNDISGYKFVTQMKDFFTNEMKTFPGYTQGNHSGILAGTGHFSKDHTDISYKTDYYNIPLQVVIKVQVTQHTGGDSDQWLLHEVEDIYRSNNYDKLGLLTKGSILLNIGTDRVLWLGFGGGEYLWVNNNLVIRISYVDLEGSKPDPIEIVQAYLQKFPSTIPATLVLDKDHDKEWIKDEMERRLWLGEKWFSHQATNNTDISETLQEVNDHLQTFLDYRDKYFGVSAKTEKQALYQLLSTQNFQGMKDKLTEYKSWWDANKSGSISLPWFS